MSLRGLVLRGAGHLAVRQGLGMIVSLVGILWLTRLIGPQAYGLYAAFLGVFTFIASLSRWGIDVYLIRKEREEGTRDLDQAFSFLLVLATLNAVVAWMCLPLIQHWLQLEQVGLIGVAFVIGLPLHVVSLVPKAGLERLMDYRLVAWIELGAQLAFFLVAVPVAQLEFGVLAPVAGWWATQLVNSGFMFLASGYRPRWHWRRARMETMVAYGLGYSASQWVWQLRDLINPLIVGRFVGLEAVGFVALAIRLVISLSFVKNATYRLSITAFARVRHDPPRLLRAMEEGMRLQVLALGPILLAFVIVAPFVLPLLFGPDWSPVLQVLPFIAVSYLANSLFNLHSSTLYVLGRNLDVGVFHALYVLLFGASAALLIPRLGLVGYGWGALIAVIAYVVVHIAVVRHVGRLDYRLPGAWAGAFALAIFAPWVGAWALIGVVAVGLWPETWRALRGHWATLRSLRRG